jgi:hypothetical protein
VSGTGEWLLGIIALAVAVMAVIQVAAIVAALRLARRVEHMANELETSIKPLVANLATLTVEATRTASLATAQVERFDRLFGEMTVRAEHTLTSAQRLLSGPAREGMAIVTGVRAAIAAFQSLRETSRRRTSHSAAGEEEEESLFIG